MLIPPLPDLAALLSRLVSQDTRFLQLDWAQPAGQAPLNLIPEHFTLTETVNQPDELELHVLSPSAGVNLAELLGQQLTLRWRLPDGSDRPWHGHVFHARQLGADGGLARYVLTLRPWLAALAMRLNCRVFHDQTAQQIIDAVFADHPNLARWRFQLNRPLRVRPLCVQYRESDLDFVHRLLAAEGLSYRFEHLPVAGATSASASGTSPTSPAASPTSSAPAAAGGAASDHPARHGLVIFDGGDVDARPALGPVRFAHALASDTLSGPQDSVRAFAAGYRAAANAVTLATWDERRHAGLSAQATTDPGSLPALEVYDGLGSAGHLGADDDFPFDPATLEQAAARAVAVLEREAEHHEGAGGVRRFAAGHTFELVDHAAFGAAPLAGDHRRDGAFTLWRVEHHAANNLGTELANWLNEPTLERGEYTNQFTCVTTPMTLAPRYQPRPTAWGTQSAKVVAVQDGALTGLDRQGGQGGLSGTVSTERDHRIKIRFPWQGASGSGAQPDSPADAAGIWVRVAVPWAGANWGAVLLPRVGSEVAVEFLHHDIDRPIVIGALYNGQERPPFAAGADSGVNHPGTLSGWQTRGLADGAPTNQWVMDDATGQLRMRLHTRYTGAELGLGHLIGQPAAGAQRGSWRGAGFEVATQGWSTVRAAQGLLLSSTARLGTYGSALGGQMDAAEAVAQAKAAADLGQRLDAAAMASGALGGAPLRVNALIAHFDPGQLGMLPAMVNGQAGRHDPAGQRIEGVAMGAVGGGADISAPVPAFAKPVLVLDTPASASYASEADLSLFAGEALSATSQGDVHWASAATAASVSGATTSLFTHAGGIQLKAAHGPVSLRAHTDALQVLADQAIQVVSVNGEVTVSAKGKIELIGGDSGIVLDGPNITFTTPGTWLAKGAIKEFLGGGSGAAELPVLPTNLQQLNNWIEINHRDPDGQPMAGQKYKIFFEDGGVISGALDAQGHARHENVPSKALRVEYEPRQPEKDASWNSLSTMVSAAQSRLS